LVERLLQQGADSNSIEKYALMLAKRDGHSQALQLIEEHRGPRLATFDGHCDKKMNRKGDADGVGTHDADEGLSERALQPVSMIHSSLGARAYDHQAAPPESLSAEPSRTLVAAGAAAVAVAVPVCSPDSGQTSDSQTRAGSGVNSDDNDTADDERVGVKRRRL